MDIRPKLPPITSSPNFISSQYTLHIKHPGYGSEDDSLLQFVNFDKGVDYDLVIYACCIVAGNAWPLEMKDHKRIKTRHDGGTLGYVYLSLSKTANKEEAITRPDNGILTSSAYYLHNEAGDIHYPFTPSFSHWIFPHDDLPPPWQKIAISTPACSAGLSDDSRQATLTRDQTCRITNSYTALERAHIIPRSADRWYRVNFMGSYTGPMGIDSMENSMALRKDVHHLWDKNMEIIMLPKEREGKYHLVSHAFKATRATFKEIKQQYHNLECQDLYEIRREYLYARFAWSIFNANTVSSLKSGRGAYKVLLSAEDSIYPQVRVKDIFGGQVPPASLPRTDLPDSSPPTKKRSLSRSNKKSYYYSVDNEIIDLYPYSGTGEEDNEDVKTARNNTRYYYSVDNEMIDLYPYGSTRDEDGEDDEDEDDDDDDDEAANSNARYWYTVDNEVVDLYPYSNKYDRDDDQRIGRKRRRSDSFGSNSTPPLSQSLITVNSGSRSDSAVADPRVTESKKVDSRNKDDVTDGVAPSECQVAWRDAKGV